MLQPLNYAAGQSNGSDAIEWTDPPAELVTAARAHLEGDLGVLYDTDPDRYGPIGFSEHDA